MLTRRFGRTGLQMPVFSFGGMRFQQSWRDTGQPIDPRSQAQAEAIVRRALDLGINHIETAHGYGTSERQLGDVLRGIDRDRVILQTKVAPAPDPNTFVSHVRQSMSRLGVERVDLLSLHGINTYEKLHWSVRSRGCLAAARQLQADGVVGHVGFSTHGSTELILDAIATPTDDGFDYVNLHWYFISQRNWPAVQAAHEADMGVFIISPSDKGGRLYDPPTRLRDLCEPLDPLVFNNAWCLSRPEVHTLSLGAARPSDFDPVGPSLANIADPARLAHVERRLATAMREAVGVDHPEELAAGLPSFESVPGYVNVRVIVWLRALALGWGMVDYARGRYRMLGTAGDWFPGISAAHARDSSLGRALRSSPFADEVPMWLEQANELLGGAAVARLSQSD